MINNRQELEAALERADSMMDEPPAPDTPEADEFMALVEAIHQWRPEETDSPEAELEQLERRLAAFREKYGEKQKAFSPGFGFQRDLRPH